MQRTTGSIATSIVLGLALAACGSSDDAAVPDAGTAADPTAADPTAAASTSAVEDSPAEEQSVADDGSDQETSGGDGTATTVTATNFQFDTSTIEVADGDVIEFTVAEGSHSLTSANAGFDTGVFADDTVTVTVDADPGTYTFRCTLHGQMTGDITVTN